MKLLLLAIGKRHDPQLAAAIDDYTQRLQKTFRVEWRLLEPARGHRDAALVKQQETAALEAELQPQDFVILLDERGQQWSSTELAVQLSKIQQQSSGRLVVVIGGAYGVQDNLRRQASRVWSLSKLVFPHQLVRLVLVEQLYRATTINAGHPYHHQ